MTSIYKTINEYGYVMVGYSAIKLLGAEAAIILCRLIDEYNFAIKHENTCGDYFLVNISNLSEILNFDRNIIATRFEQLRELELLNYWNSEIEDTCIVTLKMDDIIDFIKIQEIKQRFPRWNDRLNDMQNGKYCEIYYSPSTEELREYAYCCNEYMVYPEICFAVCNWRIRQFEKECQENFWNVKGKEIEEHLYDNECKADDLFGLICEYTENIN